MVERSTINAARRKYRVKHKELGLCTNDSNPVYAGTVRCIKCLSKHYTDNKQYYEINKEKRLDYFSKQKQKRRSDGCCITCGKPKVEEIDDGYVQCFNCRHTIHKPYHANKLVELFNDTGKSMTSKNVMTLLNNL